MHSNQIQVMDSTECTRIKKPPSYLADYRCHNVSSSKYVSTVLYPTTSYLSYIQNALTLTNFCLTLFGTSDPTT